MTTITWDKQDTRIYETGIDRVVLYPQGSSGVVWNGLISVKDNPSGGDTTSNYVDGIKYQSDQSIEGFSASIDAFTYPDEFSEYDGISDIKTGQSRKTFGLCYRTLIGNAFDGIDHGYKLHLVYNALATPSIKNYVTIEDALKPSVFSWNITTIPIPIDGEKASSHLIIDSTKAYANVLALVEQLLYGNDELGAGLPSPAEIMAIFEESAVLVITDNGDGTFTASGPDEILSFLDPTTFQISWESAVYIDPVTYTLYSL